MSISFSKMAEEGNNLMVVDALNLAFRWKHSGATKFFKEYLATIDSLKKSYKAKYVVLVSDKGASSYRKEILPEYKDNRQEAYANQTEQEKEDFLEFKKDFNAALDYIRENANYPVLVFPDTEADDIAAYITEFCINELFAVDHTWLISTDRDWDLLVDDNVSRFSYIIRKEISKNNWSKHYDYPIDCHLSVKCLMGDSGDNIKGITDVGPKRAANLINTYGSAMDVADAIPIISHLKFIKNVNASRDIILSNYKLMDLRTFCCDALGSNIQEIDTVLNQYITNKDMETQN